MTDTVPRDAPPSQQLVATGLPSIDDLESLKATTGSVTCRLVDDQAVLQCKRCGREAQVATEPRRDFLSAVRGFVAAHEECSG